MATWLLTFITQEMWPAPVQLQHKTLELLEGSNMKCWCVSLKPHPDHINWNQGAWQPRFCTVEA